MKFFCARNALTVEIGGIGDSNKIGDMESEKDNGSRICLLEKNCSTRHAEFLIV